MSLPLTRTPTDALTRTYPVENSPLAARFLAGLAERFGIVAEAVYLHTGRWLDLPSGVRSERILRAGQGDFVDQATLELYVHAGRSGGMVSEAQAEAIFALFLETLADVGAHLDYPRVYHTEELTYCRYSKNGFARQPIPTAAAHDIRHSVDIAYIDHLTLRHLLAAGEKSLNALPAVVETGAALRCFFDKAGAPRPLALFYRPPKGHEADVLAERLTDIIYAYLKPRDIRDAVTPASIRPILRDYRTLTAEERFALARG